MNSTLTLFELDEHDKSLINCLVSDENDWIHIKESDIKDESYSFYNIFNDLYSYYTNLNIDYNEIPKNIKLKIYSNILYYKNY